MKILFWVLLYLSIGFGVSLICFIYDVQASKEWYKSNGINDEDVCIIIGVTIVWPLVAVLGIFILLGKFVTKRLTKLLIQIKKDVIDDG